MKEFIKTIKYIIYKYAMLKELCYNNAEIEFDKDVIYISYRRFLGQEEVDYLIITQEMFENPKQELLKIMEIEKQQELKRKKEKEEIAKKRKIRMEKAKKRRAVKEEEKELELYKKLKLKYEKDIR